MRVICSMRYHNHVWEGLQADHGPLMTDCMQAVRTLARARFIQKGSVEMHPDEHSCHPCPDWLITALLQIWVQACRMLHLCALSFTREMRTSRGLVHSDIGVLEPLRACGLEYLTLSTMLQKYAEGLTAPPRLLLRSWMAAESCSWGDRLLKAFQQPFSRT